MTSSSSSTVEPDHVLLWLDNHMGQQRNNRTSKVDLATNATPDHVPSSERSVDIDNLIGSAEEICQDGSQMNMLLNNPLQMFTNKDECLQSIRENINAKKRVFLISSGTMGESIVPEIHELLSKYIYIFCGYIPKHEWAYEYTDDLCMFDHEADLFIRLLRDIAKYYIEKSESDSSNPFSSMEYLKWARRLTVRANKLDGPAHATYGLKDIDDRLARLNPPKSNDVNVDDDDPVGQDADEG